MSWSIFKSRGLPVAAAWLVAAWPAGAWACSVCFSARAANLRAYWGTALFLMILPIAMILGFSIWLIRRQRGCAAIRPSPSPELPLAKPLKP